MAALLVLFIKLTSMTFNRETVYIDELSSSIDYSAKLCGPDVAAFRVLRGNGD